MGLLDGNGLQIDPNLTPAPEAPSAAPASKPKKSGGKGVENALSLLGTLAGLAGKLTFGPDFDGDLGSPFKAGADMLKSKREEKQLMELMGSNPHTAPLLEHGAALVDAGGLVNNQDLLEHPDVQNMFAGKPDLLNSVSKMGRPSLDAGGQLQAPQLNQLSPANLQVPATQAPTPSNAAANLGIPNALTGEAPKLGDIDVNDPQTFAKLTSIFGPEFAQKALLSKIQQKSNPLDQITQVLGLQTAVQKLQNNETPAEKRAADKAVRKEMAAENRAEINRTQEIAREESKRLKREELLPEERDQLKAFDELENIQNQIAVATPKDFVPSQDLGLLATEGGLIGDIVAQKIDPVTAQLAKLNKTRTAVQNRAISGLSSSDQERAFTTRQLPQLSDDPKFYKMIQANDRVALKENKLRALQRIYERGGDISNAVDPKIVELYKAIRPKLYADPEKVRDMYNDPKMKEALDMLKSAGYDIRYQIPTDLNRK